MTYLWIVVYATGCVFDIKPSRINQATVYVQGLRGVIYGLRRIRKTRLSGESMTWLGVHKKERNEKEKKQDSKDYLVSCFFFQ